MTVEELKRFKYLCMEIREIEKRRKVLDNILNDTSETDSDRNCTKKMLDEYNTLLTQKKAERLDELYRIEGFINAISDPRTRLIFALRYISMLSWQKIAFKIGHYDEQYPRKIHKKYLEKTQNSCDLKKNIV